VEGAISLVTELADGDSVEVAMIGRDGIVGGSSALDDGTAGCGAFVQMQGMGFTLEIGAARKMARESEAFRDVLIRHEQLILAQAQQSAACNAKHELKTRIARWLLWARDVSGHDNLSVTQEQLAQLLGVRRTSVTMIAQSLQRAGVIAYRRGSLEVREPEALQTIACECYHTIKQRYELIPQVGAQHLV